MATDDHGREGLSAGAIAKELEVTPGKVKKALTELSISPDFVKSGCGYYYTQRVEELKAALT